MGTLREFNIPLPTGTRLTKKRGFDPHCVAIALYHLPEAPGTLIPRFKKRSGQEVDQTLKDHMREGYGEKKLFICHFDMLFDRYSFDDTVCLCTVVNAHIASQLR